MASTITQSGETAERIPFRVAPLRAGEAPTAAEQATTTVNPWGSAEDADRWEAGNMAKVLLGRGDYADAVKHFAGEFQRDPAGAKLYTAAVYDDMAKANPKQAVQFASQMKAAGLAAEASAGDGKILAAPIPPTATPGQLPPAKPGETDIRIPADPKPEPEKKPGTTEGGPGGLGGAVGISATQTGMPTVQENGGIAAGGKSGKATSPASVILRGATGGARARILRPITKTSSVGGYIGKVIPFLGAFSTFLDFLDYINSPEPPPPSA